MSPRKRSVWEQVKSGFLIAGELVGGFLVYVLAALSLRRLISPSPTAHFSDYLTASIVMVVVIVIIYVTAERWGGFIPGFFLIQGAWKGTFYAIFPAAPNSSHGVNRPEAAFLASYCLVLLGALWRFIPPRRVRVTLVDRLTLTIFALSIALVMALPNWQGFTPVYIACGGAVPLLVAWALHQWKRRSPRKQNQTPMPGAIGEKP